MSEAKMPEYSELREIPMSEIATHNKEENAWVVYKGLVVDCSKYLDDHPGGVNIVMDFAGTDCTESFEDTGHSEEALELTYDMVIGKLEGYEPQEEEEETHDLVQKQDNTVLVLGAAAAAIAATGYFVLKRSKVL
eukprot:snap_masked-scaffold_20-processed-gene-3.2-mRNA-1 protein AED:0.01 eAED:0.01 QI:0/-1/0/1/-1/1/1/0/134